VCCDAVMSTTDHRFAETIAEVARLMQSEGTAQRTLQKMVELAPTMVSGCDYAGVSLVAGDNFTTPAASDSVPGAVDRIQYETGQGPCLDAIRHHSVFITEDLRTETRWPAFAARAAAETGVLSMLSFRLFLDASTLGSLNLYSAAAGAFTDDSRVVGAVFAAHAAVAFAAAQEHDRAEVLRRELRTSRKDSDRYSQQAEIAIAMQHSMLTELPSVAPLTIAARYRAAAGAAEVGGDWYDTFKLPAQQVALVIGDIEGHDLPATIYMGQVRNSLRALAVDRQDTPAHLLERLDLVLEQLGSSHTVTCIYAQIGLDPNGRWKLNLANAGHLPPLLITNDEAHYLSGATEPMLGIGRGQPRTNHRVTLPADSTLLLYTDGLIERRDRDIDTSLALLQRTAASLADQPIEDVCDQLLSRLAPHPTDDVCLLALRTPTIQRAEQPSHEISQRVG
jgi:serine phosphatase RsbU (regulator of sigma subunit)/putative methionine-R-sulfoxide reductase with GAF domain